MSVADPLVIGVVRVEDPHLALPEQKALAVEIIVKILVLVGTDVVGRQVGEDTYIEQESLCPVHHQGLGRDLHDDRLHARVRHIAEGLLQNSGLRRRIIGGDPHVSIEDLDRADQADPEPGRFQDGLDHIGCGRLALGARDADDLHLRRGVLVVSRCDIGHGIARILHADDHRLFDRRLSREIREIQVLLHDQRRGAVHKCLSRELVSVADRSYDTEKQAARRDLSGIVDDLCDLCRAERAGSVGICNDFACQCIEMIIQFTDQFCDLHMLSPNCEFYNLSPHTAYCPCRSMN